MTIIKATMDYASSIALIESESIEVPWTEKQILNAINNENYDFLVALEDGKVVGYVGIEWCLDEGNICNIAVKSEYRGRKIGENLVSNIIALAKVNGAKTLFLEVNEHNIVAKNLYEKFDFLIYNIRKNYYKGANALCMKKQL